MGISRGAQRVMRQRSRNPLAKTRAFGKTHLKKEIRTIHYRRARNIAVITRRPLELKPQSSSC